ncbi:hypothetical protein TcasGA2_TC002776 [Tribolium castaneum]|uniref:Uncharacterized protein n=1 Tax=Tribolium castaneum TaxID=7070 RepID=D6WDG4_TRICA|nr:hypothetical protein TcasGA2_TC002776 [Tribolium castaneum]
MDGSHPFIRIIEAVIRNYKCVFNEKNGVNFSPSIRIFCVTLAWVPLSIITTRRQSLISTISLRRRLINAGEIHLCGLLLRNVINKRRSVRSQETKKFAPISISPVIKLMDSNLSTWRDVWTNGKSDNSKEICDKAKTFLRVASDKALMELPDKTYHLLLHLHNRSREITFRLNHLGEKGPYFKLHRRYLASQIITFALDIYTFEENDAIYSWIFAGQIILIRFENFYTREIRG